MVRALARQVHRLRLAQGSFAHSLFSKTLTYWLYTGCFFVWHATNQGSSRGSSSQLIMSRCALDQADKRNLSLLIYSGSWRSGHIARRRRFSFAAAGVTCETTLRPYPIWPRKEGSPWRLSRFVLFCPPRDFPAQKTTANPLFRIFAVG